MTKQDFDIIIIGAGPAGTTLALNLAPTGLRIAVIEKEVFPRDKICGDALGGKVMNALKRIPDNAYNDFLHQVNKTPSWGIRFVAPNLKFLDVPFKLTYHSPEPAPGYLCRRRDFDYYLFNRLKKYPNIRVFQGEKVILIKKIHERIMVESGNNCFYGNLVAGADGVHSSARKFLHPETINKKHFCVGIRAYFDNVSYPEPDHFIELVFLKELLPGYLWIFPSENGLTNVGLGIRQDKVKQGKENLVTFFLRLIKEHPFLCPRFKNARQASRIEAHTLPLGTASLPRSGNRTLLLGDAAFLVDPFTGEGIGNAMASGEIAAKVIKNCFNTNDFSDQALKQYDCDIQRRLIAEFKTSAKIQRLAKSAFLFDLIVNKARKNQEIRNILIGMYDDENLKKKLTRPGYYLRVLFQ
ncbi:MAG: NAD(P)/FAD-dependent oxidoreductase [Bacteroidales bacterium]|nr:NAD(P)/FAD-dependent oxidoreductase [Bacteroidales bacterium]